MFQEAIIKLSESLKQLVKDDISLTAVVDTSDIFTNYKKRKRYYAIQAFERALHEVRQSAAELQAIRNPTEIAVRDQIFELLPNLDSKDSKQLQKTVSKMVILAKLLSTAKNDGFSITAPKRIPDDIAADATADIKELEKCYEHGCYRSCVIMCGRLLETALHRKYYETTDFDILEKNPGIGLGNLVAKLAEKNVKLEPGLTQQIHLINQVRIFSVHKKKEAFYPSKEQTQAIILYTMDCLKKLF